MRRLDDFVDEHDVKVIDYIKCDVEGAELLVIKGGLESICKFKPILQLEMLRKWSAKYKYHPNDIINILKDKGYICCVYDKGQLCEFGYVDESTVETNYYFFHREKFSNSEHIIEV